MCLEAIENKIHIVKSDKNGSSPRKFAQSGGKSCGAIIQVEDIHNKLVNRGLFSKYTFVLP